MPTQDSSFYDDSNDGISKLQKASFRETLEKDDTGKDECKIQTIESGSHQEDFDYPCLLCNFKTSEKFDLHSHIIETHHDIFSIKTMEPSVPAKPLHLELRPVLRGFKCGVVGCDFRTTHLNPFMYVHLKDPPPECRELRQAQFEAPSKPVVSVRRRFYCVHCKYKCKTSEKLSKHVHKRHSEKKSDTVERKIKTLRSIVAQNQKAQQTNDLKKILVGPTISNDVDQLSSENVDTDEANAVIEAETEEESQPEADVVSEVASSSHSGLSTDNEESGENSKSSDEACAQIVHELELLAKSTLIDDVSETEDQSSSQDIQSDGNSSAQTDLSTENEMSHTDLSQLPQKVLNGSKKKSKRSAKVSDLNESNSSEDNSNRNYKTQKDLKGRQRCKKLVKDSESISEVKNPSQSASEEVLKQHQSPGLASAEEEIRMASEDMPEKQVLVGEDLKDSEVEEVPALNQRHSLELSSSATVEDEMNGSASEEGVVRNFGQFLEGEAPMDSEAEEVPALNQVELSTSSTGANSVESDEMNAFAAETIENHSENFILDIPEKSICSALVAIEQTPETPNDISIQISSSSETICREVIDAAVKILEAPANIRPEVGNNRETQTSSTSTRKPIERLRRVTGDGSWLDRILQATESAEPNNDQNESTKNGEEMIEEEPLLEDDLHLSDQFIESILCNEHEQLTNDEDHSADFSNSEEDHAVEIIGKEAQLQSNLESSQATFHEEVECRSHKVSNENFEEENRESTKQSPPSTNKSNCVDEPQIANSSLEENSQLEISSECSSVQAILDTPVDKSLKQGTFSESQFNVSTIVDSSFNKNLQTETSGVLTVLDSTVDGTLQSEKLSESHCPDVSTIVDSSFNETLQNETSGVSKVLDGALQPEMLPESRSPDVSTVVDPSFNENLLNETSGVLSVLDKTVNETLPPKEISESHCPDVSTTTDSSCNESLQNENSAECSGVLTVPDSTVDETLPQEMLPERQCSDIPSVVDSTAQDILQLDDSSECSDVVTILDTSVEDTLLNETLPESHCSGVVTILDSTADETLPNETSSDTNCSAVLTNVDSSVEDNLQVEESSDTDCSGVISITDSSFEDSQENVQSEMSSDRSILVDPGTFSATEEDLDLEMTVSIEPDFHQLSFNVQSREQNDEVVENVTEEALSAPVDEDLTSVDRVGNEEQETEVESANPPNENGQFLIGENSTESADENAERPQLEVQPLEVVEEIFPDVPAERKRCRKRKPEEIPDENLPPKRKLTNATCRKASQEKTTVKSKEMFSGDDGHDATVIPPKTRGRPRKKKLSETENVEVSSAKRRLTTSLDGTTNQEISLSKNKKSTLSKILASNASRSRSRKFEDFSRTLESATIKILTPIIRGKRCPHCKVFKTTSHREFVKHVTTFHPDEASADYVGVDPADIEVYEKVC
jgi:hypothetical protein